MAHLKLDQFEALFSLGKPLAKYQQWYKEADHPRDEFGKWTTGFSGKSFTTEGADSLTDNTPPDPPANAKDDAASQPGWMGATANASISLNDPGLDAGTGLPNSDYIDADEAFKIPNDKDASKLGAGEVSKHIANGNMAAAKALIHANPAILWAFVKFHHPTHMDAKKAASFLNAVTNATWVQDGAFVKKAEIQPPKQTLTPEAPDGSLLGAPPLPKPVGAPKLMPFDPKKTLAPGSIADAQAQVAMKQIHDALGGSGNVAAARKIAFANPDVLTALYNCKDHGSPDAAKSAAAFLHLMTGQIFAAHKKRRFVNMPKGGIQTASNYNPQFFGTGSPGYKPPDPGEAPIPGAGLLTGNTKPEEEPEPQTAAGLLAPNTEPDWQGMSASLGDNGEDPAEWEVPDALPVPTEPADQAQSTIPPPGGALPPSAAQAAKAPPSPDAAEQPWAPVEATKTGESKGSNPGGFYTLADGTKGYAKFYKCNAPDSRILMADLTWKRADEIHLGDSIVGFDENPRDGQRRKFRPSLVERVQRVTLPSYRVTMSDGTTTVCSSDHRWLVVAGKNLRWLATDEMQPGTQLLSVGKPWTTATSFDAGYAAGILDGEGSISKVKGTAIVGFAQNKGEILDRTTATLRALGAIVGIYQRNELACQTVAVLGKVFEKARIIGMLRPPRLLTKSSLIWDGAWIKSTDKIEVVSVEHIGDTDLIAMGTTTKTLVCDGLLSHNCTEQMQTEALANSFYNALGINAPQSRLVTIDGKKAIFSPLIANGVQSTEGATAASAAKLAAHPQVQAGFAADAILANHDVFGLAHDNIMTTPDGQAHRIDNGGSLKFRAMGTAKKNFDAAMTNDEINSMRNPDYQAGKVFHGLSNETVAKQISTLAQTMTPAKVFNLALKAGFSGDGLNEQVGVINGRIQTALGWAQKNTPSNSPAAAQLENLSQQAAEQTAPPEEPETPPAPLGDKLLGGINPDTKLDAKNALTKEIPNSELILLGTGGPISAQDEKGFAAAVTASPEKFAYAAQKNWKSAWAATQMAKLLTHATGVNHYTHNDGNGTVIKSSEPEAPKLAKPAAEFDSKDIADAAHANTALTSKATDALAQWKKQGAGSALVAGLTKDDVASLYGSTYTSKTLAKRAAGLLMHKTGKHAPVIDLPNGGFGIGLNHNATAPAEAHPGEHQGMPDPSTFQPTQKSMFGITPTMSPSAMAGTIKEHHDAGNHVAAAWGQAYAVANGHVGYPDLPSPGATVAQQKAINDTEVGKVNDYKDLVVDPAYANNTMAQINNLHEQLGSAAVSDFIKTALGNKTGLGAKVLATIAQATFVGTGAVLDVEQALKANGIDASAAPSEKGGGYQIYIKSGIHPNHVDYAKGQAAAKGLAAPVPAGKTADELNYSDVDPDSASYPYVLAQTTNYAETATGYAAAGNAKDLKKFVASIIGLSGEKGPLTMAKLVHADYPTLSAAAHMKDAFIANGMKATVTVSGGKYKVNVNGVHPNHAQHVNGGVPVAPSAAASVPVTSQSKGPLFQKLPASAKQALQPWEAKSMIKWATAHGNKKLYNPATQAQQIEGDGAKLHWLATVPQSKLQMNRFADLLNTYGSLFHATPVKKPGGTATQYVLHIAPSGNAVAYPEYHTAAPAPYTPPPKKTQSYSPSTSSTPSYTSAPLKPKFEDHVKAQYGGGDPLASNAPLGIKLQSPNLPSGVAKNDLVRSDPHMQAKKLAELSASGAHDSAAWLKAHYEELEKAPVHHEADTNEHFLGATNNYPSPFLRPHEILDQAMNGIENGKQCEMPSKVTPSMLTASTPEDREHAINEIQGSYGSGSEAAEWLRDVHKIRDAAAKNNGRPSQEGAPKGQHAEFAQPDPYGVRPKTHISLPVHHESSTVTVPSAQGRTTAHENAVVPQRAGTVTGTDGRKHAMSHLHLTPGATVKVNDIAKEAGDKARALIMPLYKEHQQAVQSGDPDANSNAFDDVPRAGVDKESMHGNAMTINHYKPMLEAARAAMPSEGVIRALSPQNASQPRMRDISAAIYKSICEEMGISNDAVKEMTDDHSSWWGNAQNDGPKRIKVANNMTRGRLSHENIQPNASSTAAVTKAKVLAKSISPDYLRAYLAHRAVTQAAMERYVDGDGDLTFVRGIDKLPGLGMMGKTLSDVLAKNEGYEYKAHENTMAGYGLQHVYSGGGGVLHRQARPEDVAHSFKVSPTHGTGKDAGIAAEMEHIVTSSGGGGKYRVVGNANLADAMKTKGQFITKFLNSSGQQNDYATRQYEGGVMGDTGKTGEQWGETHGNLRHATPTGDMRKLAKDFSDLAAAAMRPMGKDYDMPVPPTREGWYQWVPDDWTPSQKHVDAFNAAHTDEDGVTRLDFDRRNYAKACM